MLKHYIHLIALSFLLILSTTVCHAEEPEKTEKVVATGYGVNADKARENAVRNAVEQVIGTYVTSDTIVKNSQLVKDEILSFSGGYVKETWIISQKQDNDGLSVVQIEATVVSTKLRRKLESLNIATKQVDGGSLFGESFSKINAQKSGSEILGKILSKYPQAAYKIDVGRPEIKSTDQNKNTAKVAIPLTVRWDNAFIDELKDVSSKVAKEEVKLADLERLHNEYYAYSARGEGSRILCFSRKAVIKGGKADACEIIETELWKNAVSKGNIDVERHFINTGSGHHFMSFLIYFKDKDNNVLDSTTWTYGNYPRDYDTLEKHGLAWEARNKLERVSGVSYPLVFWSYTPHVLLLTDGVYNTVIETEVNVENLSNAASVEVQIGK